MQVNAVQQSTIPPYAYTVGLAPMVGHELVCAGALRYSVDQVASILRSCATGMVRGKTRSATPLRVAGLGDFTLGTVHSEWLMGLIPSEYRGEPAIAWHQVIPVHPPATVDVPDLAVSPAEGRDPAWRWLFQHWDVDVPDDSHLVTTLGVLTGSRPNTVFRWEFDQWEALDRPAVEIDHAGARVAPIGVLAAIVDDWSVFLRLPVGEGLRLVDGRWIPA